MPGIVFIVDNSELKDCQTSRPYRLKNTVQHYSWGKRNDQAFIARMLGVSPEKDQPYAELWIGTHPKGPSQIIDPKNGIQPLAHWLYEKPEKRLSLTQHTSLKHGLPYLLKILSADRALSIQAHPAKKQAIALHRQDPQHYPDDNHKPEIAIAIDYLDALIGFIPEDDFASTLDIVPELKELFSHKAQEFPTLQSAILNLLAMSRDQADVIEFCNTKIHSRLVKSREHSPAETLFLNQFKRFGSREIGLIFLFFLNRIQLGPGEAIFLPPGVPHAYLKGNIIECMANSDNVVRLGLTEKFCDAEALSRILVFNEVTDFSVPTSSDGFLKEYLSPTEEFLVKSLDLLQGESRAFSFRTELTLFLLLDGEINLQWDTDRSACTCVYRRGDSFIAPANLKQFSIHAKSCTKLYLVDIPTAHP